MPRGIAVCRFDRRGDDVPLDDQVEDAMSAFAALAERADIDRTRIGLFGFSQGAWVAPLAASRHPEIAFLVLVASTGVSPSAQMLYGTAKQARLAGHGDESAARIVRARRVVDEWRRGNVPLATAQREVDAIAAEPWFAHAWLPRHLDGAGSWPDMDFAPEEIFSRVRVPVLLFYGEDDEWQPIDESVAAWRRAAERAGNADVTVVRLAGTGHAPTLGGREEIDAIAPEYERTLVDWLARVAASG